MQICQLYEIFQLIGTPDDSIWPEVTSLPNWQPLFPKWQPKLLSEVRKTKTQSHNLFFIFHQRPLLPFCKTKKIK